MMLVMPSGCLASTNCPKAAAPAQQMIRLNAHVKNMLATTSSAVFHVTPKAADLDTVLLHMHVSCTWRENRFLLKVQYSNNDHDDRLTQKPHEAYAECHVTTDRLTTA